MARRSNHAMTATIHPIRLLWLFLLTAALAVATLPGMSAEAAGPRTSLEFEDARADALPQDGPGKAQFNLGAVSRDDGSLGPIRVWVLDRDGERISGGGVEIELTLTDLDGGEVKPAEAKLGGTTVQRIRQGVATFDGLQLWVNDSDQFGLRYQLKATSSGLESDSVNVVVWESFEDCSSSTGPSCTTDAGDLGAQHVDVETASKAGTLLLSLLEGEDRLEDCDGAENEPAGSYRQAPDTVLLDSPGVGEPKTATITISKALIEEDENRGNFQVCFQELDEAGDFVGEPYWLERCTSSEAPCIESRTKTGAGDAVIKIALLPGDPMFR